MPLSDYDVVLKEALTLWNVFRNMGYPSDNIFVYYSNGGKDVGLQVRHAQKTVAVRVGAVDYSEEDFRNKWDKLGTEWNSRLITGEEMDAFYRQSACYQQLLSILINMQELGLPISPEDQKKWS